MRAAILIASLLACASASLDAQSARRPNTRKGFWVGFGLGDGSAGVDCTDCPTGRLGGFSGYVRLGGTLSPSILIGFESNAWVHSESGLDQSMGFGSVVALWYPSPTGALYLKGGLGGLTYRADDGFDEYTATAPSVSLGIGYEFRLGRNFSIVPYFNTMVSSAVREHLNGVPVSSGEDIMYSLAQFGVGATWH